jgi:hypothetical protein
MQLCNSRIEKNIKKDTPSKNNNYKINKNIFKLNNNNVCEKEYSLNQNCFDPFKNSPPNLFMINLIKRINSYDSVSSFCSDNMDNKLVIE